MINSYDILDLFEVLRSLTRWQYNAFSGGCAGRVAPIFRSLGSPKTILLDEQALDLVWLGITHEIDHHKVYSLAKEMRNSPEAEEDTAGAERFAGRATNIVALALYSVLGSDPSLGACGLALDLRSQLDFTADAEAGIQATIGVVARNAEISERYETSNTPGRNDFPIRLESNG